MRFITSGLAAALLAGAAGIASALADAGHFSAGVPGDPKRPARTVTVLMHDDEGKMRFVPERVAVKKGEQIRFVLENKGVLKHEFTLASAADNRKHAAVMQKHPGMEHDDANAKSVDTGKRNEILWRFTKVGTFEFACLIPGHYEAGMHGAVTVK